MICNALDRIVIVTHYDEATDSGDIDRGPRDNIPSFGTLNDSFSLGEETLHG